MAGWLLILALASSGNGNDATSTNVVMHDFASQTTCQKAGEKAQMLAKQVSYSAGSTGDMASIKYVCMKEPVPSIGK